MTPCGFSYQIAIKIDAKYHKIKRKKGNFEVILSCRRYWTLMEIGDFSSNLLGKQ